MISGKKLQSVFKALTSHLQHSRGQSSRRKGNRRLYFTEPLEVRALLATFNVTNVNDAGTGSLREAINQANSASGVDQITFNSSLSGTISLTSGTLFIRDSVNIFGPGASQLAISGGSSNFEVIQADDLAPSLKDVQISGLTIRDGGNGTTFINGAGIFSRENLTLTHVALLNNNAGTSLGLGGGGGGALQMFAGNLKMQNCTVAGNRAKQGGGIELSTDAVSGLIVNTTISGNQAEGFGGGVLATNGAVVIRNSTITGNRANSNDLDGNTAGGGVFGNLSGTIPLLTLHNTIVAGNLWGPISASEPDDIGNPVTSDSSNNVIGNAMFSGGLVNGTNFNLVGDNGTGTRPIASILNTTLANNGGPTQTHALAANSVAINAGNNSQVIGIDGNALTTDQRGSFRIFENVDIGAVELIAVTNPIVVDTSVDENDGNVSPGGVSLREAILLANTVAGANTITFANATNGQPIDLSSLGRFEISETLTINGNGAANTIIDGGQSTIGIFLVQSSAGNVTFSGLTLRNGLASNSGGAIRFLSNGVLTINQSTLSGNSSSSSTSIGGAIFASGAVTINQSTLSGNSSSSSNGSSQGGAIFAGGAVTINQSTLSGNSSSSSSSSRGGAISAGGTVTINQSTLSGNSSSSISSNSFSQGGAIFANGTVTINQSTLSGNSSSGRGGNSLSQGGAIFTVGAVTINQSTLSGNSSSGGASGVGGAICANSNTASKTIRNSIVAGNTASNSTDISFGGSGPVTVMNSLIGRRDGTALTATTGSTPDANGNFVGGSTDATKIDPKLGPLDDNGGPTQTHELLTGSLAVNRGNNSFAVDIINGNTTLTTDQRGAGFSRIQFGTVDMGAFEFSSVDPLVGTTGNDAFVVTYPETVSGTVSVTVSTDGGPVTNLGEFPTSFSLTLNGLGGTDSLRVNGSSVNDTMTVDSSRLTVNNTRLTLLSIENRTLAAGAGSDVYKFDADAVLGDYVLDESAGGIDTLDFSLTTTVGLTVNLGSATQQTVHSTNLRLTLGSTGTFENAIGGSGADTLTGNGLNNTLTGNAGNDTLNGSAGNDILNGGQNNDTYSFGTASAAEADQVTENTNEGIDTLNFAALTTGVSLQLGSNAVQPVHTNRTLKLNSPSTFENAIGGSGADTLVGNGLNNILTGNAGNDTLNGSAGSDLLIGGQNDDIYLFGTASAPETDHVAENTNEGIDTLNFAALTTSVSIQLGSNAVQPVHVNRMLQLNSPSTFENAIGGSGADLLIGNGFNNTLTGNAGNDTLIGSAGNDVLNGGQNNDTYSFGTASATEVDQVTENTNEGIDTLNFAALATKVTLQLGSNAVQTVHTNRLLKLNSPSTFENAIGGSAADTLTGNGLNNTLTGNAGNDILMGGQNDDTYIFGPASATETDLIAEDTNGGIDTLNFTALTTSVSIQLGSNVLQTVHTNRTLQLNSPSTFENAIGGSGADTLTGNGFNNTLTGNAGNDTLIGSAGNDVLNGGLNDDTYSFGTASALEADQVTENTNEGNDTLNFAALTTGVSLQLGSNAVQTVHANRTLKLNSPSTFENAIGGSGADTLVGNALNNTLTGNAGNDSMNGSAGNDILIGGQNDDTYSFGTASATEADQVTENTNEGTDLLNFSNLSDGVTVNLSFSVAAQSVHSGRTLKLNSGVTFENILGGSGKDLLIGNSLNNRFEGGNGSDILLGNDGNDTLYGQDGRDILIGGFGSDRIFGGSDDDIVIGGWRLEDMVMSSANITEIRNALSVWENNTAYQDRVNALRQSTSVLAVGTKVKADLLTDIDILNGESGVDWLFAGATDQIFIGVDIGEIVENI